MTNFIIDLVWLLALRVMEDAGDRIERALKRLDAANMPPSDRFLLYMFIITAVRYIVGYLLMEHYKRAEWFFINLVCAYVLVYGIP